MSTSESIVRAEDRLREPIVLIDGVCHFCQGAVRFIVKRDPKGVFRFASLQSEPGTELAGGTGFEASGEPNTLVLIENGRKYVRSTAALRIARRLRFPWPLLYALILVPRPLRDAVYRYIARNRYRWFGKDDTCPIPPPGVRKRFLDAGRA
ncbi:thiol-disulfide oxidoreductase DCC family protein [Saccharibacillus sp. CPCC 101409]|uniref:thiol-disulfide oxidoreductase DCC family protein n=1 Tax=Saccharibacillus sp. CPCC 101409 TaxID=3058041 RepID=UPI00267108B2|nr:thiol-disulfide oxidoreductase DCC family protein [Saccharibacillus sp. CPCC 101409]MDO3408629.1 thiol-disulfide oxidoreductase DCC family protein [Saccharibacillus sp. CPCC 101409]